MVLFSEMEDTGRELGGEDDSDICFRHANPVFLVSHPNRDVQRVVGSSRSEEHRLE